MNGFKILSVMASIVMLAVWISLTYIIFASSGSKLSGIVFLALFLWCLLPVKHPCDYNKYSGWWADKRNWFKRK